MERDERERVILEHVQGKDVLDVGFLDHFAAMSDGIDWLHGKTCAAARSVTGLDIASEELAKLPNRYSFVVGDAHTIDLEKRFDCIVAGELIEHLENPGQFLV